MGNRAVLSQGKYSPDAIGIYLHWNGGRDSVEAFLSATKKVMEGRGEDKTYALARLVQVIGNYIGGNMSLGLGLCRTLDCDNGDNGVYEIDMNSLNIIGRRFHKGKEQREYELAVYSCCEEMTQDVLNEMPKKYRKKGE